MAALAICLAGCSTSLRGGLSEAQASEIVVALDAAAIPSTKVAEGSGAHAAFRVEVTTADATRALSLLHEHGLPRAEQPGFSDLYREQGLVATPHDERARGAVATAGELARSLARLDGVIEARVHIALTETQRPLDAEPSQAKASVLIRYGRKAIDEPAVKRLIAGAVDGLLAERITIVQQRAQRKASPARRFVRVGPAVVTAQSAPALRMLSATALMLNLVTALALVWALRRRRPEA